ncbi:MAG: hypothetical protein IPP15_08775 [Saprospiraceae bacterium]|uniref:Glycosyltransferase RgtA/B/C/D-like domain-containing protein n=1 Tax=Candidatus Opimibacter skivensis TaxID=2982028 RepID=A0A9D7SX61_9BACT|nr:hypothetical protein [Candidatus Opimibacter skivensis]
MKRYLSYIPVSALTGMALLLCLPAFLLNLGSVAFIGDEGIRTLVALEMKLSGHYLVPTLNGEGYFNKPPLYNWFIVLMSGLFGHFGEWPTRMTTLIFLGAFGWTVYFFMRKHVDRLTAISLAFMLITSGRILFWDSMLGLIDICFSWIVFLNFMALYHLGKEGRWKWMFISSYFLCSIAFLLKGLPAVVFQCISIFTTLFFYKVFRKKIFSTDHFIGAGLGLLPMLVYYILYASQVSLKNVFSILWDQSVQRTGVHYGILKTITHVFAFPFEQTYHFLPWSLLIATFFHPRFRQWLRQNPFVHFCFWMLIANLPVYWLSVQVYPRYLLMFLPLFNLIGLYILQQTMETNQKWWTIFHYTFTFLSGIVVAMILLMPLNSRVYSIQGIFLIWIIASLLMLICFAGVLFDSKRMFLWVAITLLVTRSVFNYVVLPLRAHDFTENRCREDCMRLAAAHGDKAWFIFGKTEVHEVARYYTSGYKNQIIRKTESIQDSTGYYITDLSLYPDFPGEKIDSLVLERGEVIAFMKVAHQ